MRKNNHAFIWSNHWVIRSFRKKQDPKISGLFEVRYVIYVGSNNLYIYKWENKRVRKYDFMSVRGPIVGLYHLPVKNKVLKNHDYPIFRYIIYVDPNMFQKSQLSDQYFCPSFNKYGWHIYINWKSWYFSYLICTKRLRNPTIGPNVIIQRY